MNGNDLFNKMSEVDYDLIEEASVEKKPKKKHNMIKWYALASCFCLLIIGTLVLKNYSITSPGNNAIMTPFPGEEASTTLSPHEESSTTSSPSEESSSVFIPAMILPEVTNNESLNMIGLIVYQGKIYTQSEWYQGENATKLQTLVGTRLGYAKGNIDEWSTQKDYDTEFASSIAGDVYTVNGYDTDFRLCMQGSYENEDGKLINYIQFYENLNGIGLTTGKDLFETRLKLIENWSYAKYQTHDNWNNGWPNYVYSDLSDVTNKDLDEFLSLLSSSEFVDMTNKSIYDQPSRHLFFYLKDNTRVELRLFEDGYVGYQSLGWYFVQMPGDTFDKIYNACR